MTRVGAWLAAVAIAFGQASAQDAPAADAPAVVTSRSKQFRVSGSEGVARGVAAILAERTKDQFLSLMGEEDRWKVPVLIVLHGKVGDQSPPRTLATRGWLVGDVWQLQLDKHMGPGLESGLFRRAITEILIFERSLTAQGNELVDAPLRVPLWLSVGLLEAIDWRFQQSDRAVYASLFRSGGLTGLADLFDMDNDRYAALDAAAREAFRVSAGSLVMALLEQPGGIDGFRLLLGRVAPYQGEMPMLLREFFPGLNLSQNSLDKWWALQLANKGDLNPLTDVLGIAETGRLLEKALFLEITGDSGARERIGLDQWSRLQPMSQAERMAAVKPSQAALMHLSYRCFPSCRPLLVEYQKALIRIATGQTESVDVVLQQLADARWLMAGRAGRGRDYLDWFEITRARETSGAFDDYLRLKQELKLRQRNRNDGLSAYLDRMDAVFERGGDESPRSPDSFE